jgi:hypothetical protein
MKIYRVRLKHKDKPGIARKWLKIVGGDKVLFVVGTVVGTIAKIETESTFCMTTSGWRKPNWSYPRGIHHDT